MALCHSIAYEDLTIYLLYCSREFGGGYAGLCYGRSVRYDTAVTELLVVSGVKEPCTDSKNAFCSHH